VSKQNSSSRSSSSGSSQGVCITTFYKCLGTSLSAVLIVIVLFRLVYLCTLVSQCSITITARLAEGVNTEVLFLHS
jgi:hypothetical protein